MIVERTTSTRDFVRLAMIFARNSGTALYQGPVVRKAAPVLSLALYLYIVVRDRRPQIIAAEIDGTMLGGVLLSKFGNFEMAAIDERRPERDECFALLARRVEAILIEGRGRRLGYWTLRPSLVRAGHRHGFKKTERERYLVTAKLGPLRCSWLARQPIPHKRLLDSTPMHYMQRDPDDIT